MKRENYGQISVKGPTYERITRDLPKNERGRVRPGEIIARMENIINTALDRETGKA